ncbi:hypothetical protein [Tsukamurella soli]|uniref:FMN-binding domain-containing protein n=1 Tax=Tsukamurella soli TaxID=644556 RepID=A0ABP8JFN3_9ACTN
MTYRIASRAAIAAIALVAPLAGCSGTDTAARASSPADPPPTGARSTGAAYRNGTYTARGVYGGAPSYMTVTVTVRAGTITAVTVTPMPINNDTSRGYQERFAAAVPGVVIGKRLADVEVGKLAGASGCPDGFNDALAKIRRQAGIANRIRETENRSG